jgi:hypothetical protein
LFKKWLLTGAIQENCHATHPPHAGRHSFCRSDTRRRTNQQPLDSIYDRKSSKANRAKTTNRADKTHDEPNVTYLDTNLTDPHTNTGSDTCANNWTCARSDTGTHTRSSTGTRSGTRRAHTSANS